MRFPKFSLIVSLALVGACGLFALSACAGGFTGGVAATVNGVDIPEDEVTAYIQNYRAANGLDTDEAWADWLEARGMTAEDVRDQGIDYYANIELIKQAAEENNITVDQAVVDQQVSQMKSRYADDAAWNNALASAGLTEEAYRENLELAIMQEELAKAVVPEADEVSDEDIMGYAGMYAQGYDGMKRSSHILFSADDADTARSVLEQIKNGSLSFEDAVAQYSTDTASAANGGDVGWDRLNSFVTEYTDGLNDLAVGEVSDLVTSDFGIHIIKCTDEFVAPDNVTAVDQLPAEVTDQIRATIVQQKQSLAFQSWLSEREESAEIVKNDPPNGLPYFVATLEVMSESASVSEEESAEGTEPVEVTEEEVTIEPEDAANESGN